MVIIIRTDMRSSRFIVQYVTAEGRFLIKFAFGLCEFSSLGVFARQTLDSRIGFLLQRFRTLGEEKSNALRAKLLMAAFSFTPNS